MIMQKSVLNTLTFDFYICYFAIILCYYHFSSFFVISQATMKYVLSNKCVLTVLKTSLEPAVDPF